MKDSRFLCNKSNLETDWRQLGYETKRITSLLNEAISLSGHLMRVTKTRQLRKAVAAMSIFRSDAEDEMFRRGGTRDIGIFYGEAPDNKEERFTDLRRSILAEVVSWLRARMLPNSRGGISSCILTFKDTTDMECGILGSKVPLEKQATGLKRLQEDK